VSDLPQWALDRVTAFCEKRGLRWVDAPRSQHHALARLLVSVRQEHMLRGEILRLEAEVKRLREAAQMLGSAVGDVLSGWDARRQLDAGAAGMGHNILIEAAGKYTSLSCWIRVRRYYDALCAALNPTAPEPDYKRWWAELAQRPEPQADGDAGPKP